MQHSRNGAPPAAAGASPCPTNDEARTTAPTVSGPSDQEITTRPEYATAPLLYAMPTSQNLIFGQAEDAARKEFATLQATAALRGFRLDRIEADDGGVAYVITRWALTKQINSLDELRAFVEQIGGTHAG